MKLSYHFDAIRKKKYVVKTIADYRFKKTISGHP